MTSMILAISSLILSIAALAAAVWSIVMWAKVIKFLCDRTSDQDGESSAAAKKMQPQS